MNGTDHCPRRPGRWVGVRLQHRHVRVDESPGVSYQGILISSYADGTLVAEQWVPLGADPSEEDDEALIGQLREALRWQSGAVD
ncbi:hypothetical protein [Amycolatopsis benzoatilytica]|uniref:hypothetical protein n=1 Tax=Amycolatopsis benzoatilytica TaxID=346045 RepID=UPI0003743151|nr:hypothetical protein [Amycolatopsis benzoatilytica]